MIKTANIADMLKQEEDFLWVVDNFQSEKERFMESFIFDQYKGWEYLMALNDIRATYDWREVLTIVDIGSRRSWFPFMLALKYPNSTVWATDIDSPDVYFTNGMPKTPPNLKFKQMFSEQTEMVFGKGQVDIITCMSVIEHIDKEIDSYWAMLNALRTNGILLMSTDLCLGKTCNRVPNRYYNFQMLQRRFDIIGDTITTPPRSIDIETVDQQLKKMDDNRELYHKLSDKVKGLFEFSDRNGLSAYWKMVRK